VSLLAGKATVGALTKGAFGWITAAGGILSSRRARVGIGTETVIKIEAATEIELETMTEIGIETAMQIETTAGVQTKIRSSPVRRTTCTGITVRRIREVACNC
jgi:hypothetical protein